uniref:TELO2-interacting protein 2 n=1 Tax=Myxine glutinosa TaxID=7769 RepID=UPI00358F7BB0
MAIGLDVLIERLGLRDLADRVRFDDLSPDDGLEGPANGPEAPDNGPEGPDNGSVGPNNHNGSEGPNNGSEGPNNGSEGPNNGAALVLHRLADRLGSGSLPEDPGTWLDRFFSLVEGSWLFGLDLGSVEPLVRAHRALTSAARTFLALPKCPPIGGGNLPAEVYVDLRDRAPGLLRAFERLLAKGVDLRERSDKGRQCVCSVLRASGPNLLLLAVTFIEPHTWSGPAAVHAAAQLLSLLRRMSDVQDDQMLLSPEPGHNRGLAKAALAILRPVLTRETWAEDESSRHVFVWLCLHIVRPSLAPHIPALLPPCLILLDDYRLPNQLLGLQCIKHIIANTPAAVLRWQDRAEVIYHAIHKQLYSRNAQLLQATYPCLLNMLTVIEEGRTTTGARPLQTGPGRTDAVVRLTLWHVGIEECEDVRLAYIQALAPLIDRLQVGAVRHMKLLLPTLISFLQAWDGPDGKTRQAALNSLMHMIRHAWPRLIHRRGELVQALLRFVCEVSGGSLEGPPLAQNVQQTLLEGATECLVLLDRASLGDVKNLLKGVKHHTDDPKLMACILAVDNA